MQYGISILGILVVLFLAWLASSNRKKIKFKPIITMIVIQILLSLLLLNTEFGLIIIKGIAAAFSMLLEFANEGISFVFGGMANEGEAPFFLNVLLPIVFISALIGILQYFKILPFLMKGIGLLLSKVNGMGKLESYNAVASLMVGQSEVFITLKKQLDLDFEPAFVYSMCFGDVDCINVHSWCLYDDAGAKICCHSFSFKFIWRFYHSFYY